MSELRKNPNTVVPEAELDPRELKESARKTTKKVITTILT